MIMMPTIIFNRTDLNQAMDSTDKTITKTLTTAFSGVDPNKAIQSFDEVTMI